MEYISRDSYLNQLIASIGDGQIKVITGLRRCGKSFLLSSLFMDYLIKQGTNSNAFIKFSLNKKQDAIYRDADSLSREIEKRIAKIRENHVFIFVDEIQLCLPSIDSRDSSKTISFYDVLNDYQGDPKFDIYVTGSNSHLLSKDIATDFRGKGRVIEMHPLSFKEYHEYKKGDLLTDYNDFFTFGGMPYVAAHCHSDIEKETYLNNLFKETYIKDIKDHVGAKREDVLNELVLDLCSSIGSLTNPNKISKTLKSNKVILISDDTISSYLSGCIDSFLFIEAKRYDVKGKKYFAYPNKYYCADIGLRNCWLNLRQQDETHIMENIIFCELISRGFHPDVGVVELFGKDDSGKTIRLTTEIDFVLNTSHGKIYIQSAFNISDDEKKAKELRPLLNINDFSKRIVVTNHTPKPYVDETGIIYCSIIDFLLNTDFLNF